MNPRSAPRSHLVIIGQQPGEEGRASKYDPAHCDTIRELAQKGQFPEVWMATIGIHQATLYRWADLHFEFAEAIAEAWVILEAYWTRYAEANLTNDKLRTQILLKIMTARFPHTYGRFASHTFEHFRDRNMPKEQKTVPGADPGATEPRTRSQMVERIAELTRRLAEREGKT